MFSTMLLSCWALSLPEYALLCTSVPALRPCGLTTADQKTLEKVCAERIEMLKNKLLYNENERFECRQRVEKKYKKSPLSLIDLYTLSADQAGNSKSYQLFCAGSIAVFLSNVVYQIINPTNIIIEYFSWSTDKSGIGHRKVSVASLHMLSKISALIFTKEYSNVAK
jgi:hypothetical protein